MKHLNSGAWRFALLLVLAFSGTATAQEIWGDGRHPMSAFGQGSCSNLSATNAVAACTRKCQAENCDFFWVYTSGSSAGRCCPKTWSMYDASRGFRDTANGSTYRMKPFPVGVGASTPITEWMPERHPVSALGQGRCTNLGSTDPLNQCAAQCDGEDCDYFWLYTDGNATGRCCTKDWSMYDPARGLREINTGFMYTRSAQTGGPTPGNALSGSEFTMLIGSDPQPFFKKYLNYPDLVNDIEANKTMIHWTTQKMIEEGSIAGVIINGDLTNKGEPKHVDAYNNLVKGVIKSKYTLYPGLGNHDIESTLNGGCANNHCARYWVKELEDFINTNPPGRVSSDGIHYAWQKEKYLFVQLNLSPFYEADINYKVSGVTDTFPFVDFEQNKTRRLRSAWPFLERMNTKAVNDGLKLVLNFHAYGGPNSTSFGWDHQRFVDFLEGSNTVAIFVGHIHTCLGPMKGDYGSNADNCPGWGTPSVIALNRFGQPLNVIYSGAMYLGSYLKVKFGKDKISVEPKRQYFPNYSTDAFDGHEMRKFDIFPLQKKAMLRHDIQ